LFDAEKMQQYARTVREHYGIRQEVGVVLYMPTFRDDLSMEGYQMDFEGVLRAFEQRFQKEFVMLIRLHPNVQKQSDELITYNERFINGTYFNDAQMLYAAADYLITDYSSAPFDFTILKKPVFLFALDKEEYQYRLTDIYNELPFPMAQSNPEMVQAVGTFDKADYDEKLERFMLKWNSYESGQAADQIAEWIFRVCE
jgi:CDP-glycerol glycerophosphotransferase